MKAIEFEGHNIVIAKDQPQYIPLPAFHNPEEGSVTFCFKLTDDELNRLYATGELWFKQLTFNGPMNPIALSTNKEELIPEHAEA